MRKKFVDCAKAFAGVQQGSERHKQIVDTYNSYLPHPRGYTLSYTAPWCAAFPSAVAILCDMQGIFPIECSCGEQINGWKAMGRWQEADDYRPNRGDLCYYDWQDGKDYATTDNTGAPDHVGIVVFCVGSKILVIEGNKGDTHVVGYRELDVNGRYIRGYGLPDFEAFDEQTCNVKLLALARGVTGGAVMALQALLNLHGAALDVDGSFGGLTQAAVTAYKQNNGLPGNGIVDGETWTALLAGRKGAS